MLDGMDEMTIPGIDRLGSGLRFSGDVFRKLCQPCVYVVLCDNAPLYIVMSRNGISRPARPDHHQVKAFNECDEVLIYPVETAQDAKRVERALIQYFQPQYNGRAHVRYGAGEVLGLGRRQIKRLTRDYQHSACFDGKG